MITPAIEIATVFQKARTRIAVLEIMKDDLVSMALYDPTDSRRANTNAWAQGERCTRAARLPHIGFARVARGSDPHCRYSLRAPR